MRNFFNMNFTKIIKDVKDLSLDDLNFDISAFKLPIKIMNKSKNPDPTYAKEGDSGLDLMAYLDEDVNFEQQLIIKPLERVIVPTGIFIELPRGFEAQVRPRSGLAFKNGVTVLNTPGTIDNGFRGEIKVILINFGSEDFIIDNGMKIAQLCICPVATPSTILNIVSVDELSSTDRGESGFGSTGV